MGVGQQQDWAGEELMLEPKVKIESYRYDGPHRNWNPRLHKIVDGYEHYCWRYRITVDGLTVYYRSGFCSYDRATASLSRNLPKVLYPLTAKEQE